MASDNAMEWAVKKCGGFLEKLERESPKSYATFLRDMASFDPFLNADKEASLDHLRHVVFKPQPKLLKHFQQYLQQPETSDDHDCDDANRLPDYLRVRNKSNYSILACAESDIPRGHVLNNGFCELLPATQRNFKSRNISSEEENNELKREEKLFEADMLPVLLKRLVEKLVKAGPKFLTPHQLELIKAQIKERRLTRGIIRKLTPNALSHLALRLTHKRMESKLAILDRRIQSRLHWRKLHLLAGEDKHDHILDDLRSKMKTMELELNLLAHQIPSRNSSTAYNLVQPPKQKNITHT